MNTVYRTASCLTPPLDWLGWLHAHGASVCEPLSTPHAHGEWIVAVPGAQTVFLATATRWADGARLSDVPPTPEVYRE